ncbi:MAG: SusD/RagB family nutrient-binding outer membrane lipoprotein, partial [Bacteroidetes bacterium]|nr:SusD/RagB family nutrient-binding outer membrane lipoprotein [Candidatus Cryptobacteroides faecigallinarum]
YPVEEYEQNNANVNAAITMIGEENSLNGGSGDSMASRVWWDVKPYSEIK